MDINCLSPFPGSGVGLRGQSGHGHLWCCHRWDTHSALSVHVSHSRGDRAGHTVTSL